MATILERQKAAQMRAAERATKRALSLSIALLRADALYEAFTTAAKDVDAADAGARAEASDAALKLRNTAFSRADAMATVHFGALYAVADKWQEWKFSDPTVDKLLADPNLTLLKQHRHAVFHADHYDHGSFKALGEKPGAFEWAARTAAAIRAYLKRFHADPAKHVIDHIKRTGW